MSEEKVKPEETTARIIAAAGEVFGERGFRAATVRQVTARAGVNLAAVNYHFKSKEELYVRVLMEAKRHLRLIVIADMPGGPEDKLRGFINSFVHYLLDPKRPLWHARVLAMEMSNPTPALGVVIRELTAPIYRDLRALVDEIMQGSASPVELDLITQSVCGQCLFYVCSRPMAERLGVHLNRTRDRTRLIANHVAAFSLLAMKGFDQGRAKKPKRSRQAPAHQLALS